MRGFLLPEILAARAVLNSDDGCLYPAQCQQRSHTNKRYPHQRMHPEGRGIFYLDDSRTNSGQCTNDEDGKERRPVALLVARIGKTTCLAGGAHGKHAVKQCATPAHGATPAQRHIADGRQVSDEPPSAGRLWPARAHPRTPCPPAKARRR